MVLKEAHCAEFLLCPMSGYYLKNTIFFQQQIFSLWFILEFNEAVLLIIQMKPNNNLKLENVDRVILGSHFFEQATTNAFV